MKFSEIANRLTGISTPLLGVSWQPTDLEVSAARRVIAFPSRVMQVVKQSCARRWLRIHRKRVDARQGDLWDLALDQAHVWQRRFYDFVVWNEHKRAQKLGYMHRNPVTRGLVLEPEQWCWSSYRYYAYGESGAVLVNELQKAELKLGPTAVVPTLRKPRRVGQPH